MEKKSKKPKHGAKSDRARALHKRYPKMSYAELGRRSGMTTQGARNAVLTFARIGSKKLMRAEALTPIKAKLGGDKKAA